MSYDPLPMQLIEEFAETLRLTKATKSGEPEPLIILPHAREFMSKLFGQKRGDGKRQYRKAYFSTARKNAKTQYAALIGLALLLFDSEAQPEIYIAAADFTQAGHVFSAARDLVLSNPELAEQVEIVEYAKKISYPANKGVLQALSSIGRTKHGSNPSTVIFDELHVWGVEHQELYAALTTGSVARRQPLQISITTAGSEEQSICGREYDYAKRVLNGTVDDPTYLAVIHEVPKDADWTDESLWHLANPALDNIVDREQLREACKAALQSPHLQNEFRRLHLNQWTEAATAWIPLELWDRGAEPIDESILEGIPAIGGLDLAAVSDLTAFVLVWNVNGYLYVKPWFFLPEDGLAERSKRDGVKYEAWVQAGFIELTPGSATDWIFVTDRIRGLARRFNVRDIAFDRYGGRDVASRLADDGFEVIDFGQGFLDMSPPCKRIEQLAQTGKIRHGGNPVLRWNIACSTVAVDAAGNIKPVKPDRRKSNKRIDGVIAMAMAEGLNMRRRNSGEYSYEILAL